MFKEKLGSLTSKEKEEILQLLERKSALQELLNALDSQSFTDEEKKDLRIKIVNDLEENQKNSEKWKSDILQKNNWKIENGEKLRIDFEASEIFIAQEI